MKRSAFLGVFLFLSASLIAVVYFVSLKDQPCANSITCIKDISVRVQNDTPGIFLGKPIDVPTIDLAADISPAISVNQDNSIQSVLGDQIESSGSALQNQIEKHIYVDLDAQKLYAYEDTEPVFETLVSTGLWGWTPTGDFKIWLKVRSQLMSGGSGADYYYLPNVPYNMFFYNDKIPQGRGYALHGAYWHNNFGHEMSHGCVNLREIDAKFLYEWTNPVPQGHSTRPTHENPSTPITICQSLEIKEGEIPTCHE